MKHKLTDIHNHSLFGVDDGARSIEHSIEMLELSCESGAGDVILTPHCYPGLYENYAGQRLTRRFEELKAEAAAQKLPLNIHLGMEVFGCFSTPEDYRQGRLCTLAGSDYLLIEFDFNGFAQQTYDILGELVEMGVKPVVAHPERYSFVARSPSVLYKWLDMGCLLQCNKESINGKFGRMIQQIACDMLSDKLYSFVGSDAHGATTRTPFMKYVYEYTAENFGEGYAYEIFCENPKKIILNDIIH